MSASPSLFQVPYGRYSPRDKSSFAYTTVSKRWPVIIANIVSTVSNDMHALHAAQDEASRAKVEEGKSIISKLGTIKHEMGKNAVLTYVPCYVEDPRTS